MNVSCMLLTCVRCVFLEKIASVYVINLYSPKFLAHAIYVCIALNIQ